MAALWRSRDSSFRTATGTRTVPNYSCNSPSLPMMARFESGEVLLTTIIGKVSGEVGIGVVAWDIAPCEFIAHLETIEPGKCPGLDVSQRAAGIERAGRLNPHAPRYVLRRDVTP